VSVLSTSAQTANNEDAAYLEGLPKRTLQREITERHRGLERDKDGTYVPGAKLDAYTAACQEQEAREKREAPQSYWVSTTAGMQCSV